MGREIESLQGIGGSCKNKYKEFKVDPVLSCGRCGRIKNASNNDASNNDASNNDASNNASNRFQIRENGRRLRSTFRRQPPGGDFTNLHFGQKNFPLIWQQKCPLKTKAKNVSFNNLQNY
jgi:hypothetical protein